MVAQSGSAVAVLPWPHRWGDPLSRFRLASGARCSSAPCCCRTYFVGRCFGNPERSLQHFSDMGESFGLQQAAAQPDHCIALSLGESLDKCRGCWRSITHSAVNRAKEWVVPPGFRKAVLQLFLRPRATLRLPPWSASVLIETSPRGVLAQVQGYTSTESPAKIGRKKLECGQSTVRVISEHSESDNDPVSRIKMCG